MAIDYGKYLSDQDKKSIINQRLVQFAAEAYQHELNKQAAVAVSNEEAVNVADAALVVIEEAINLHEAELASLPADVPVAE